MIKTDPFFFFKCSWNYGQLASWTFYLGWGAHWLCQKALAVCLSQLMRKADAAYYQQQQIADVGSCITISGSVTPS